MGRGSRPRGSSQGLETKQAQSCLAPEEGGKPEEIAWTDQLRCCRDSAALFGVRPCPFVRRGLCGILNLVSDQGQHNSRQSTGREHDKRQRRCAEIPASRLSREILAAIEVKAVAPEVSFPPTGSRSRIWSEKRSPLFLA
jgi:hypothetical protein